MARDEFVAIQGRSGAGKTTLLNLIGGLDIPNAGQIIIKGYDITRMDETERSIYRRDHIGIVFQTGNLIPFLSGLENVMHPIEWSGVSFKRAQERAKELFNDLGLSERLNHKVNQLSGGEAQRVGIALANEPDLLLADELTGELDTVTTQNVMSVLKGLQEKYKITLLVVTHNQQVAAYAGESCISQMVSLRRRFVMNNVIVEARSLRKTYTLNSISVRALRDIFPRRSFALRRSPTTSLSILFLPPTASGKRILPMK